MLRNQMPKLYESCQLLLSLFDAEDQENILFQNELKILFDEFFIDSSVKNFSRWEKISGFSITSENTVWDELEKKNTIFNDVEGSTWDTFELLFPTEMDDRRSKIKSRIRGAGTVTVTSLKNVCNAYVGGEVAIQEVPTEYKVIIEFIDARGIPTNMETLKKVVRDIMPAHLGIEYRYRYITWNEIDTNNWSWDTLDAKQLTYDALSKYKEGV